ncbi:hypothetical protein QYM36_002277, partial [Artemia franciscana]
MRYIGFMYIEGSSHSIAVQKGYSQDSLEYVYLQDIGKRLINDEQIPIIPDLIQMDSITHYVHEDGLELLKKFRSHSIAVLKGYSQDSLEYVYLQDIGKRLINDEQIPITPDLIQMDSITHYVHEDGLDLLKKFRSHSIAVLKGYSQDFLEYVYLQDIGKRLINDEQIPITPDLIQMDTITHYVHEDGLELLKKFRSHSIAVLKGYSQDSLEYVYLQDIGKRLINDEQIPITPDLIQMDSITHYVHEDGLELLKKFRRRSNKSKNNDSKPQKSNTTPMPSVLPNSAISAKDHIALSKLIQYQMSVTFSSQIDIPKHLKATILREIAVHYFSKSVVEEIYSE